jgi:hypothetical protein
MIQSISPVSPGAVDLTQILALAMAQIVEQSTQLALLNLQVAVGANPEGVGELLDILA